MAEENYIDAKLELYLSYEYLTAEQYSNIILAINRVYQGVATAIYEDESLYFKRPIYIRPFSIPLCIEEVRTGNSINVKFSFAKGFFPGIKIDKDDTINIIVPRWSAILIISGLILSYGIEKYKDYLDIRLKQLEINEKIRNEANFQSGELNRAVINNENPLISDIQQSTYLFNSQIYQSNFSEIRINGEIIHQKPNRNP